MSDIISVKRVNGYQMASSQQAIIQHSETDIIVSNNGFFPDIALNDLRNTMRIDGTVTNERLKFAVIEAIATANQDLADFRQKQAQHQQLSDCSKEIINGENVLVQRYKRAVYCLAIANLNERYRSYDTTKNGEDNAERLEETINDLRRDARFAIRDMQGMSRISVRLI